MARPPIIISYGSGIASALAEGLVAKDPSMDPGQIVKENAERLNANDLSVVKPLKLVDKSTPMRIWRLKKDKPDNREK